MMSATDSMPAAWQAAKEAAVAADLLRKAEEAAEALSQQACAWPSCK